MLVVCVHGCLVYRCYDLKHSWQTRPFLVDDQCVCMMEYAFWLEMNGLIREHSAHVCMYVLYSLP